MKHTIHTVLTTLTLLCLALAGCQPVDIDEVADEVVGTGGARLHIRTTAYEFLPFSTRASLPVSEACSRLGIRMFKLNGEGVFATKSQKVGDASFGSLDVALSPGTYILVCVGHNGEGNATLTSPTEVKFANNKMTDTFVACDTLELDDGEQTASVILRRRVAKVQLVLDDKVPSNVQQLKFYYTGGSSTLNAATGYGAVNSRQTEILDVPTKAHTTTGSTYDIYTLPHADSDQLRITITALDQYGMTVAERELTDVPVRVNEITRVYTSLFGGGVMPGSGGITMRVDGTEWTYNDIFL